MPDDHPRTTALLILAAGRSQRMGQPKQLLPIGHQTLLHRTVHTALRSQATSVTVILGAEFEACSNALQDIQNSKLTLLKNLQYQSGLASSIHCGINYFQTQTAIDSVIISVCDQPDLTPEIFNQLIQFHSNQPIVASSYAGIVGVPARFDRTLFSELLNLEGDRGARHLIQRYQQQHKIDVIPFESGAIDLDTIADYQAFLDRMPNLHAKPSRPLASGPLASGRIHDNEDPE